ncbi:MAG: hypothetical protein DRI90_20600 [Deltaproteobacteria bacterium]|nr:MAG: hypothetical protein DRI90_20600 [Deltaproteobacteria bacterium]
MPNPRGASDSSRRTGLPIARDYAATVLDTGRGAIEIGDGAAATLGCGATERDLRTEGRVVKRGGPIPAPTKRAVRLRDRDRCRVPGCGRRRYVDVHHIEHQGAGGTHARGNCCVLCTTHHGQLHRGQLRVEGDADAELRFYDEAGEPIVVRRPRLGAGPMTQCGPPAVLSLEAVRLLSTMGTRGGWHPDALCAATGMSYGDVSGALLTLVLAGCVEETFSCYRALAGALP